MNKPTKRYTATEVEDLLCGLSETEDFDELFSSDSDGSEEDLFTPSTVELIIDEESFSESDLDICENDTMTVTNQKDDADDATDDSTQPPALDSIADVVEIMIDFPTSTLRSTSESNEAESDPTSTPHKHKKRSLISSIDAALNENNYDRISIPYEKNFQSFIETGQGKKNKKESITWSNTPPNLVGRQKSTNIINGSVGVKGC